MKVCVIRDDPPILGHLEDMLKRRDYQVMTAGMEGAASGQMRSLSLKRHRFQSAVTRQEVWLYYRFSLSLRDVEEILAERGIDVSCEAIRFGPSSLIVPARAEFSSLERGFAVMEVDNWSSLCIPGA